MRANHLGWALGSIVALYILSRAAIISTSVSPSRDGGRYFAYASSLHDKPWIDVIRGSVDHPGYPFVLSATLTLGENYGVTSRAARVRLAQVTTAGCGLLMTVVAYFLARHVWGALVAWSGTVAFVLLPRPMWQTSDILSDPLYAFFWLLAALLLVRAISELEAEARASPHRGLLLASGFVGSLAYWTRVDALTFAAAAGAAIAIVGFVERKRPEWSVPQVVKRIAWLSAGFLIGLVLFYLVRGQLSGKPATRVFFGFFGEFGGTFGGTAASASGSQTLAFAASTPGLLSGLKRVVEKFAQELQYVFAVLAALGAWIALRSGRRRPGGIFLGVAFGVYAAVLSTVSLRAGYLSSRFVLVLTPAACCLSFYALFRVGEKVRSACGLETILARAVSLRCLISFGLILGLVVSLPSLLRRQLHDGVHGQNQAVEWIAERLSEGDSLYVENFFSAYRAGLDERNTGTPFPRRFGASSRHFAVLNAKDVARNAYLRKGLASRGAARVARFPQRPGDDERRVEVYVFSAR